MKVIEKQEPLLSNQSQTQMLNFTIYVNDIKSFARMDNKTFQVGEIKINIIDMIGLVKKQVNQQNYQKYTLYYYPRRKKMFRSQQRYVQNFGFQIRDIKDWMSTQNKIISRIYNRKYPCSFKVLIVFNPVSGKNSSTHLTKVLNFIKYTNLEAEIFTTNHRNHCVEYLKDLNSTDYCGIAIVSGDGLMHEYVNSFCKIPVTHVPAGSGNAFAKNQTYFAGQLCKAEQSIYLLIKNRRKNFNLVKYQLEKLEEPIYSFLSLQWAFFADMDIRSESLRCLGSLRFQFYAIYLLLKLKRYRARITYSTIQTQIPSFGTNLENNPNYLSIQYNLSHIMFFSIPYISQKHKIAPLIKPESHFIDMQFINYQESRFNLLKYLIASESGTHFDLEQEQPAQGFKFSHKKVTSFRLQPLQGTNVSYCIDGEVYQQQKLQASLSQKTFEAFI